MKEMYKEEKGISHDTLTHSPTFRALLQDFKLCGQSPDIIIDNNLGYAGHYDDQKKSLVIWGNLNEEGRNGTLVHEMRHAYLDLVKQVYDFRCNKKESRRSNILLMEADAVAFEITVAYELKERAPSLWEYYCGYNNFYARMCAIFDTAVQNDQKSLWNGEAAHVVFCAYLSDEGYRNLYFNDRDVFPRMNSCKKNLPLSRSVQSLNKYFHAKVGMPYADSSGEQTHRQRYLSPSRCDEIFHALTNL